MSHRWVDHTGELELELEASTESGVFVEAAAAFADLLGSDGDGDGVVREIRLPAAERAVQLVEWLDELVYLAETESLVPEVVARLELSARGLVASVRCRRGAPRHLVKGATYHRLAFEPTKQGFCGRVVLDV